VQKPNLFDYNKSNRFVPGGHSASEGVLIMWRLDDEDWFPGGDDYDLHFVRSRPVGDEEADLIEVICQAATPGPLTTDERCHLGGTLVATLPDGRHIVSLRALGGSLADARSTAAANAQLICEARSLVLRLLRDRQRWKCRERCLLERIQALEDELQRQCEMIDEGEWPHEEPAPSRPR
jgi:hypothetical protein